MARRSFLEHLLHDDHFIGGLEMNPIKSVGASAGEISISVKSCQHSCLLATGEPLQNCLDILDRSEHVGAR